MPSISIGEYIDLVDATGRKVRADKRGAIPAEEHRVQTFLRSVEFSRALSLLCVECQVFLALRRLEALEALRLFRGDGGALASASVEMEPKRLD